MFSLLLCRYPYYMIYFVLIDEFATSISSRRLNNWTRLCCPKALKTTEMIQDLKCYSRSTKHIHYLCRAMDSMFPIIPESLKPIKLCLSYDRRYDEIRIPKPTSASLTHGDLYKKLPLFDLKKNVLLADVLPQSVSNTLRHQFFKPIQTQACVLQPYPYYLMPEHRLKILGALPKLTSSHFSSSLSLHGIWLHYIYTDMLMFNDHAFKRPVLY